MALTFANKVTIGRILAVPIFIAIVLYYSPQRDYLRYWALGIFLLAMITDMVDGYIARTRQQKTRAGAILDPLADKMLLMSAFICLYKIGVFFSIVHFPVWLVVGVISRDVILLLGAMLIYLVHGQLSLAPSQWGKASTLFQALSIIGMLLQWPDFLELWYVTIVLTTVSGVGYIYNGIKVLNAPSAKNIF